MGSFLNSSFHSISLVICSYAVVVVLYYLSFVAGFEFRVFRSSNFDFFFHGNVIPREYEDSSKSENLKHTSLEIEAVTLFIIYLF